MLVVAKLELFGIPGCLRCTTPGIIPSFKLFMPSAPRRVNWDLSCLQLVCYLLRITIHGEGIKQSRLHARTGMIAVSARRSTARHEYQCNNNIKCPSLLIDYTLQWIDMIKEVTICIHALSTFLKFRWSSGLTSTTLSSSFLTTLSLFARYAFEISSSFTSVSLSIADWEVCVVPSRCGALSICCKE